MSKSIASAMAVSLFLSGTAFAFNPQPDPPGKRLTTQSNKALGGPDTKSKGWKGGSNSVPAMQKSLGRR
jgi:hypothetical protein